MFLSVSGLMGRFHPVLVHLPIGILLLACFFQWLSIKERFALLRPAIPVMLFWGVLSGIFSCLTGYMLSLSADYDADLVEQHQWLGILSVTASLIFYLLYKFSFNEKMARWFSLGIIVLITITGHLGGSLTHGSDYLTSALHNNQEGPALKPIPNIQEAALYPGVVQPLLQARCYSCHGPEKQKGKLRLDQQNFILKGGKDGVALIAGKADESEMIRRILLPVSNEKHMPPKEKPQLTAEEIALLHWWINTGADFNKKIKDLPQTEKIKPVLIALQSGNVKKEENAMPDQQVAKADETIVSRLKKAGVIVVPVAQNSNYLSANFVNANADSLITLLEPLKEQLLWLKLDHAAINDAAMPVIGKLTTLTKLQLSNTLVTDQGITALQSLHHLASLNLTGTKVTAKGIERLKPLKALRYLYLYQTDVKNQEWTSLQKAFPATRLDSGKYIVASLPTDTMIVKPPPKKM